MTAAWQTPRNGAQRSIFHNSICFEDFASKLLGCGIFKDKMPTEKTSD